MDHTNTPPDQNSSQPSSDSGFIPFTEAQLKVLTARQAQYFGEARQKMNYDAELAGQLDDRVAAAVSQGKRVTVVLERAGFVCE